MPLWRWIQVSGSMEDIPQQDGLLRASYTGATPYLRFGNLFRASFVTTQYSGAFLAARSLLDTDGRRFWNGI
jgi:hypothetical protein